MARGRKKKDDIGSKRQKLSGDFLVDIVDEKKERAYLAGISWDEVVALHFTPKVKITKIETIDTLHARPSDITKRSLRKLAALKK